MEDDASTGDRDWTRIALILSCALAAAAAAALVPAIASEGLAGSPADRILPGDRLPAEESNGSEMGNSPVEVTGGSSLGALNPGSETVVGGKIGDDDTFNNTDTAVHFEVESQRGAYWRTATYDRYTGSGWAQTGTSEPYDGTLDYDGLPGEEFAYEVHLEQRATGLPTAWRPESVEDVDVDLEVAPGGAIRTTEPVPAGGSFTATSTLPERDVSVLRAAGGDYPTEISERYTDLPSETPDRIGDFTADLIADAETNYDAAMAIQNWLRTEKDYSLEASASGEGIADQFIFEMEAGYCEYFATAMVTMLRSQGIPARYVVGYSTGERVGDGRYEVRGMNAHAWVEVFFPDVGWVRFDPTPGDERLAAQADALGGNPDLREEGSPGETFEPGEIEQEDADEGNETGGDDGTDENDGSGGEESLVIELNRTAAPGAAVEVTVTRGGEPVINGGVLFNGQPVGVTDEDGTVAGTVPFAEELRISVDDGATATLDYQFWTNSVEEWNSDENGSGTDDAEKLRSAVDDEPDATVPVETGATVTLSGEPESGGDVTVSASVEGVPVPNATVAVGGEAVGETDADGRATVTLPDRTGTVAIAVEREPVSGETTVEIPDIELAVEADWPVALPGTTATVEVTTDDGEAVAGASIRVGGETVATTGPDGTATVRLPLADEGVVTATAHGLTRQGTVGGLYRNAAFLLVFLVGVVGAGVSGLVRRGDTPADVARGLRSVVHAFVTATRRGLVLAVTQGRPLVGRGVGLILAAVGAVVALSRGQRTPGELWLALRVWLRESDPRGRAPVDAGNGSRDTTEPQLSIREAWQRFLATVSVSRTGTRTPGELARHAVEEDGLPDEPVRTLRDAFREVEYGDRAASSRLERVQQAIDEIERAREEPERATDGGERRED
ncbi:MAG: transglutaminaseTgpA domain-containing protein [Halovenus sp.]